jgi:hypothetical protein
VRKALFVTLLVTILVFGLIGTAFGHDLTVTTPSGEAPVVTQPTGDDPAGPSGHAAICGLDQAESNPSGTATFEGPECP